MWRVIKPLGMGDRRPVLIGKGKTGLFSEPFVGVPGWAFAIALKAVFPDFPRETTPPLEFFQQLSFVSEIFLLYSCDDTFL